MLRGVVQELAAVAGVESAIQRIVQLARERMGMDLAWVSHFQDGHMVVQTLSGALPGTPVATGFTAELHGTYCLRALVGDIPPVVPDTRANPITCGMPVTTALGIGAYLGVVLRTSDGLLYGTLCCVSVSPRPDLRQRDLDVLTLLAGLIEQAIDDQTKAHAARLEVSTRIRRVLEDGGPRIVYQAIHALPDREIVGYEALSRFPADLPGPAEWFAAAAEVDLGPELQLAALQQALPALDVLPPATWLAINLSPTAICSSALPPLIPHRHAGRIVIEMTEHDEIADYDRLRTAMGGLRELGVRFAADDAGSGYAGMRHLIEIRPDLIKMDYHLTHHIDRDPARTAMATALHAFAAATGATLLAEGVETAAELATVVDLGIGLAQGHHLGRPVDLSTVGRSTADH